MLPGWDSTIGTDNGHNLDVDPLFLHPDGNDLQLHPLSPVIDAGDNAAHPDDGPDLAGNPRIVDADHDAIPTIDLGAYEHLVPPDSDGDGIPDAFELLHTHPPSPVDLDPGADADFDHLDNLAEFVFALDPGVPDASPFLFTLVEVGSSRQAQLSWTVDTAAFDFVGITLQSSADCIEWDTTHTVPLPPFMPSPDRTFIQHQSLDPVSGEPRRFYRILIQPW